MNLSEHVGLYVVLPRVKSMEVPTVNKDCEAWVVDMAVRLLANILSITSH